MHHSPRRPRRPGRSGARSDGAGLCARGADALQGAVWGVHLHARAGEVLARQMGPLGFLARELLAEIPPLLARMSSG